MMNEVVIVWLVHKLCSSVSVILVPAALIRQTEIDVCRRHPPFPTFFLGWVTYASTGDFAAFNSRNSAAAPAAVSCEAALNDVVQNCPLVSSVSFSESVTFS